MLETYSLPLPGSLEALACVGRLYASSLISMFLIFINNTLIRMSVGRKWKQPRNPAKTTHIPVWVKAMLTSKLCSEPRCVLGGGNKSYAEVQALPHWWTIHGLEIASEFPTDLLGNQDCVLLKPGVCPEYELINMLAYDNAHVPILKSIVSIIQYVQSTSR